MRTAKYLQPSKARATSNEHIVPSERRSATDSPAPSKPESLKLHELRHGSCRAELGNYIRV